MAVTKTPGGVITSRIALTCEATAAVANGDAVMLDGDYEVVVADGSAPVIGQVVSIRKDFPAAGGNRVATVPGEVAVDAYGFCVHTYPSSAATVTAGETVGIDSGGKLAPSGAGVADIGVALTSSAAEDDDVDVLCR